MIMMMMHVEVIRLIFATNRAVCHRHIDREFDGNGDVYPYAQLIMLTKMMYALIDVAIGASHLLQCCFGETVPLQSVSSENIRFISQGAIFILLGK